VTKVRKEVLEEFDGFVDRVEGNVAYVTLLSSTGEMLCGEYPISELEDKGIRERRRFKCLTVDTGEAVKLELYSVPDCEVTEEQEGVIREEIDRALGDDEGKVCGRVRNWSS
jgi:hypothetical protein